MFFIEYSKDILFLVLAFSVLWLTAFATVLVYLLIKAAKQVNSAADELKNQVSLIGKAITSIKDKVEHSFSYASLIGDGLKKLVDLIKDLKSDKQTESKKTKIAKDQ